MSWARIMAPLAGAAADRGLLESARVLAEGFGAELACVHAPADMADLMPWMGEGFMGGVQVTALESLKEAAVEGHHTVDKLVASWAMPAARPSAWNRRSGRAWPWRDGCRT
jgi:hypothetical protein